MLEQLPCDSFDPFEIEELMEGEEEKDADAQKLVEQKAGDVGIQKEDHDECHGDVQYDFSFHNHYTSLGYWMVS